MNSEWYYKGNTRWAVMTQGDDVVVEWGNVKTGKLQSKRYAATAKNVGKSNEVSAEDQAVKEALALIKKKEDSGYVKKGETSTHFLPMLAKDASKLKKWPQAKKYYVQPKLDGIRAVLTKDGVFSRKGKKIDFVVGLEDEIGDGIYIDGEIYKHGTDFQTLVSWVKQGTAVENGASFCAFDTYRVGVPDWTFKNRYAQYSDTKYEASVNLQLVPTAEFTTKDLDHDQIQGIVQDVHDVYVANGYEGVMIRLDKPYEVGKRSSSLWKYKNFKTEEYTIVGYKPCKKIGDRQPFVYTCKTDEGKEFNVTPQYTQNDRCNEEIFLTNLNKLLTVKYQELTNDGIPRFPVGVSVRDYE